MTSCDETANDVVSDPYVYSQQLVEAVRGGGLGALMTDLIILVARDTPPSALDELKERVQGYHDDRIRGECLSLLRFERNIVRNGAH